MRSLGFTFLLAFAAVLTGGLCLWHWQSGNFNTLLGAPAVETGGRLYTNFTADQVKHLSIHCATSTATFSLKPTGWQAATPWEDRMDPRAAASIIQFTLGMTVEDAARTGDVPTAAAGLADNAIDIRLEDANHRPLAKYRLGRMAPWKAEIKDQPQPMATVYVQPRDKHRKNHIYICAGDINPLFRNNLNFLRDHRPLYFNPLSLEKIRIRSAQGEITLGRESPKSPWRVVKPLDLPTDPAAMKSLLEGLFDLQAIHLSDRSAVTLPTSGPSADAKQIALTAFGGPEILLDVQAPESPDARTCKATVSDRPATVFDLPLKPEPGLVSLASLPLTLNELRDPMLTRMQVASISGISIQPSTSPEIVISRAPNQPWMATISGKSQQANELNLYRLLKAVTSTRVAGFASDAATDFTPWGLDRPLLKLRFLGTDHQSIELHFGLAPSGALFMHRLGTPTVVQLSPDFLSAIAVRPHEWRHGRLWSLNRVNLLAIERTLANQAPWLLRYKFIDESWQAESAEKNVTDTLDSDRANFLLTTLESLKVDQWLDAADPAALAALATPSAVINVTEKNVNEAGELTGIIQHRILFAPANPAVAPGSFYGSMPAEEPHPFLISREIYEKLTLPLEQP